MEIGGFLCGLIFGLAIGTAIGAVILRAAISLYNSLAGGPDSDSSVPEPSFGEAMGIVFATSLVNLAVGFALVFALGPGMLGQGRDAQLRAQLISLPISILVMTLMLSAMLPTTFLRALMVAVCQIIVSLLIIGVIVAVVLAVGLAI